MRGQHCSGQQGGAEAIGAESWSCRRAALSQQGLSLDTAFGDAGKPNSFFHACHWEVWAALIRQRKISEHSGLPLISWQWLFCCISAALQTAPQQLQSHSCPLHHTKHQGMDLTTTLLPLYHPTAPAALGLPWRTTHC